MRLGSMLLVKMNDLRPISRYDLSGIHPSHNLSKNVVLRNDLLIQHALN